MSAASPIVALATATGRGAVGIVRVSGLDLAPLRDAILGRTTPPREAVFTPFLGADGEPIDQGLAIFFPAPRSYTGEDVLELQAHGGPVVLQLLLARLLALGRDIGLRVALPGEFTERAYLNGKLDLAQAEAVADLINAQSTQAARLASRSLVGEFSRRVNTLLAALTRMRMLVEATLDFPEEETDVLAEADVAGQLDVLTGQVAAVLEQASAGARLREGITIVIAGEPNVGKSSLLNRLAGEAIAIVTPVAGTTRDRIRETILLEGIPINLVDTAGLRETDDMLERIGIEIAEREIAGADLVLLLESAEVAASPMAGETSRDSGEGHPDVSATAASGHPAFQSPAIELASRAGISVLRVLNKIDLVDGPAGCDADGRIRLSALTGDGVDLLRERLLERAGWVQGAEAQFMARERHLVALRRAAHHLAQAQTVLAQGLELFAEELRLAQQSLGEVTGEFTADDLLGEIFRSFCIGK